MSSILFLSDAWLAAVDDALALVPPPTGPTRVSIEYRVSGGPEGDTVHQFTFGPGRMRAHRPRFTPAVTLTLAWDLAVAINQGEVSAQGAFLDGRIQLSGDPGVLLAHRHDLAKIDEALASVRTMTTSVQTLH